MTLFMHKGSTFIIGSQLIDSSYRTLNSVKSCCQYGSFSDANILVRKYRDDLLLYLYILVLKETDIAGKIKTEKDNQGKEAVIAWRRDKLHQINGYGSLINFSNYMESIKKSEQIKQVIETCKLEKTWENIRRQLNNATHNNGYKYTMSNLVLPNDKKFENLCNDVAEKIEFITAFFLICLILIDPTLISSTDYIGYLEMGEQPPAGCQYNIPDFVQNFIDKYIVSIDSQLKIFLKDNKYGMNIK